MMVLGQVMLSQTAAAIWIAALCAVLAFHCSHVICMRGERRCYHFSHMIMLIGMIYMFGSAAFGFDWLPALPWIVIYAIIAAAIVLWMAQRFVTQGSFNGIWALAFVQQGAMVYMWEPMQRWVPLLSYGLALYFVFEALGWLVSAARPTAAPLFAGGSGSAKNPLEGKSAVGDVCLSVMAASMAYMFVAMQLAMSTPRTAEHAFHQNAPAQTLSNPAPSQPKARVDERPQENAKNQTQPQPSNSASAGAETYSIVAGDTLSGVAHRLYGDPRRWRDILEANPNLDPRRLRVGQTIKLPAPFLSR